METLRVCVLMTRRVCETWSTMYRLPLRASSASPEGPSNTPAVPKPSHTVAGLVPIRAMQELALPARVTTLPVVKLNDRM